MDTPKIIIGRGDVEVLFIKPKEKELKLIVYMDATPKEYAESQELKDLFEEKFRFAVNYLISENYIPPITEDNKWRFFAEGKARQSI